MPPSDNECFSALRLLQLADSALPVGALSHSFGLEALVFDKDIEDQAGRSPTELAWYLEDALSESLLVDAVFCREAHARASRGARTGDLNRQLSALRLARESREASLTMGRRFAALAAALHPCAELNGLAGEQELHHSVAFGYALGVLAIEAEVAVGAFLHQCVVNTISAGQRLLPLGQIQANRIAWDLKPAILEAVRHSRSISFSAVSSFAHLPELASMRHPCLPTRLFVS
ncbi:MAG TPA: urease accessory UreF family protein [Bryobacteraceae bacterium]|nr:urease accessory UreF family protein [Bryobacteraceae bacterium]